MFQKLQRWRGSNCSNIKNFFNAINSFFTSIKYLLFEVQYLLKNKYLDQFLEIQSPSLFESIKSFRQCILTKY